MQSSLRAKGARWLTCIHRAVGVLGRRSPGVRQVCPGRPARPPGWPRAAQGHDGGPVGPSRAAAVSASRSGSSPGHAWDGGGGVRGTGGGRTRAMGPGLHWGSPQDRLQCVRGHSMLHESSCTLHQALHTHLGCGLRRRSRRPGAAGAASTRRRLSLPRPPRCPAPMCTLAGWAGERDGGCCCAGWTHGG